MSEKRPASKPAQRAWIPKRPDRRGSPPAKLGDVLVGADNFVAKQMGQAIAREEWRAIVGDRIANRTRVGKKWKSTLTVQVASSAWSSELSFLKVDLLRKLQRAGHDITDLRFQVDHFAASSAPAQKQASRRFAPQQIQQNELPPDLLRRLQEVDDPNLRAAIAEAATWSLRKKKEP